MPTPSPSSIFGDIKPPIGGTKVGGYDPTLDGLSAFLRNIIFLIFIAAGLYAFFNFIFAGFDFINAGGDSNKITQAWNKIWQSLLGLVIMLASFAIAAIAGQILFGQWDFILKPTIPGP
ncbi:MAG: hypothetical protein GXP43_03550 [bacterium]|nr:hypothetical protein [bacterium]